MSKQKSTSVEDIIFNKRLVVRRPRNVGERGEFRWIDPNLLHIDHDSYQRDTNEKHAMTIGENYQYDRAKVISAYYCSVADIYYVTDGQHSAIGAALAGIPEVPIYYFNLPKGASHKDLVKKQSAQFVAINKTAKKIQKYDEFRNDLIQEEPYAIALDKLCTKHGVKLIPATQKAKTAATLSHIHNLKIAYHNIGEDSVDITFAFMRKFWPRDHLDGGLFIGLARFLSKFKLAKTRGVANSDIDEVILYNALSVNGLKNMVEADDMLNSHYMPKMTGSISNKADEWRARAIRMAYNDFIKQMALDNSKLLNERLVG